jgi:hypothetical protein
MWPARAVRFGYKWLVGDGKSIKFWEDSWYGNAPLAVIYWNVYMLVNKQTQTISELWDGQQLKCTFRRTFTDELMAQWLEILEIAKEINFNDSPDQLIWKYESNGVYSSKSLYAIVNFRGALVGIGPPVPVRKGL